MEGDNGLPDFDNPGSELDEARLGPKKSRRRPAKKAAKRAAPSPKSVKRVSKKRRVRKPSMRRNGFEEDAAYMSKKEFFLVMQINTLLTGISRESRTKILDLAKGL